jgi:CheY-like chemotaxis protein
MEKESLQESPATMEGGIKIMPLRILLAEDDLEMRNLLAGLLREEGYEVQDVEDGARLIGLLHSAVHRPLDVDLVISDVLMPGATGLEVLAFLRRSGSKIPFILITAFGNPELHAEAHTLGVSAVFDKPFDLEDLRATVRRLAPLVPLG